MPDLRYGPQTEALDALIERAGRLTLSELTALAASGDAAACAAARDAAMDAAMAAARDADAWAVACAAAWAAAVAARDAACAAGDAAFALALRGKLARKHYDVLTGPWARVIGRVHPDDPDRRGSDA